jgi:hypothetical protein
VYDSEVTTREVPLTCHPEEFRPAIVDLNVLLKPMAEKLLPLLGQRIQLGLFCASAAFPVFWGSMQVENILADLFMEAKKELNAGGVLSIQTVHCTAERGDLQDRIVPHIVATFRHTAFEDAGDIVEGSQEFLDSNSNCSSPVTVIRIYPPVANDPPVHAPLTFETCTA